MGCTSSSDTGPPAPTGNDVVDISAFYPPPINLSSPSPSVDAAPFPPIYRSAPRFPSLTVDPDLPPSSHIYLTSPSSHTFHTPRSSLSSSSTLHAPDISTSSHVCYTSSSSHTPHSSSSSHNPHDPDTSPSSHVCYTSSSHSSLIMDTSLPIVSPLSPSVDAAPLPFAPSLSSSSSTHFSLDLDVSLEDVKRYTPILSGLIKIYPGNKDSKVKWERDLVELTIDHIKEFIISIRFIDMYDGFALCGPFNNYSNFAADIMTLTRPYNTIFPDRSEIMHMRDFCKITGGSYPVFISEQSMLAAMIYTERVSFPLLEQVNPSPMYGRTFLYGDLLPLMSKSHSMLAEFFFAELTRIHKCDKRGLKECYLQGCERKTHTDLCRFGHNVQVSTLFNATCCVSSEDKEGYTIAMAIMDFAREFIAPITYAVYSESVGRAIAIPFRCDNMDCLLSYIVKKLSYNWPVGGGVYSYVDQGCHCGNYPHITMATGGRLLSGKGLRLFNRICSNVDRV